MHLEELIEEQNPWWREPERRLARRTPTRRDLQSKVLRELLRPEERRALVILGPRQVGKSTLLWQTVDDLLDRGLAPGNLTYFDFSDDRLKGEVTARQVADILPTGFDPESPRFLLLDEIRLAPGWDRWLKQAVDQGLGRIVVTDSAASVLRDKGRESGVGRWDEHWLLGLSFLEFVRLQVSGGSQEEALALRRAPEFLERYLALGGFPEHARSDDFPEVRRRLRTAIVEKAVYRDLSQEVESPERLRDLFAYLVQGSGDILNVRQRAEDLGGDERTVRRWLRLLEDTLLVTALPRREQRAVKRLRPQPRIYAADHGLIQAFSTAAEREESARSRVFEAVVLRHLRHLAEEVGGELSYFRLSEDLEIDFVLGAPEARVGVEVTASRDLKPRKVERLVRAGEKLAATRRVLIYGGMTRREAEGAVAAPLVQFLTDPRGVVLP